MSRYGCFYCKKGLGPFQYGIGLCNRCRRKLAGQVGQKVTAVSLETAHIDGAWSRNATDTERLAFEMREPTPEI